MEAEIIRLLPRRKLVFCFLFFFFPVLKCLNVSQSTAAPLFMQFTLKSLNEEPAAVWSLSKCVSGRFNHVVMTVFSWRERFPPRDGLARMLTAAKGTYMLRPPPRPPCCSTILPPSMLTLSGPAGRASSIHHGEDGGERCQLELRFPPLLLSSEACLIDGSEPPPPHIPPPLPPSCAVIKIPRRIFLLPLFRERGSVRRRAGAAL